MASEFLQVNFLTIDDHLLVLGCGKALHETCANGCYYNISEFELH